MRRLTYIVLLTLFLSGAIVAAAAPAPAAESQLYLPALAAGVATPARVVNAPYVAGADVEAKFAELALFWFGQVTRDGNYADVRIGYGDKELYVYVAAFDRRLHYPTSATGLDFTKWDAVELLIDTTGARGAAPQPTSRRFVATLNNGGDRSDLRAAFRGDGTAWRSAALPFTGHAAWRGERINDNTDDRGWAMAFRVPYTSLGLSGRPADGTLWGLGLRLFDRDGDNIFGPTRIWPENLNASRPATWGGLRFGLPTYKAPAAGATTELRIRHRLGGADVPDGAVGGGATCGEGLDFWSEWGAKTYYTLDDQPGVEQGDFNVQNQSDIADWPCFSKYYITFPLNSLPRGKVVVSAKLVLHQIGNSTTGDPNHPARPTLLQAFVVADDWKEASLSWNNAPMARENVGAGWVGLLEKFPGWPGVPREIDVSYALAQAYAEGTPLRLALYSADDGYHSGKYFVSSDTGDWNAEGRPTLVVTLGEPAR